MKRKEKPSTRGCVFFRFTCRVIKPPPTKVEHAQEERRKKNKTTDGILKKLFMYTECWHAQQNDNCSQLGNCQHKAFKAALENMYTQWQGMLIKQTVCPTSLNFSLGTRWLVYFHNFILSRTWINHRDHKQHFHLGACHQITIRRRVTFTSSVAFLKGWGGS